MSHQAFLLEALALAKRRQGFCAPNPSVGAIVVREGQIIATGYHHAAGFEHAEVVACNALANNLEATQLYITLEPCCHWGKTPPCTDIILEKGIKEVYYGYRDPNPIVLGQGEKTLRNQNVICQHIPLPQIDNFYKSYRYWTITKKPWVSAKLAISLDAKIADAFSKPVKLTGEETDLFTHQCRLQADAILTSVKTIIQDNPSLNFRKGTEVVGKSLFILDSNLKLPLDARVFSTAEKITVFYSLRDKRKIKSLELNGVNCQWVPINKGYLDLTKVIEEIGARGVHDLWVEAGGKVFCALLQQRLAQTAYLYIAPKLLGENAWPAFIENIDIFSLASEIKKFQLGDDTVYEIQYCDKN